MMSTRTIKVSNLSASYLSKHQLNHTFISSVWIETTSLISSVIIEGKAHRLFTSTQQITSTNNLLNNLHLLQLPQPTTSNTSLSISLSFYYSHFLLFHFFLCFFLLFFSMIPNTQHFHSHHPFYHFHPSPFFPDNPTHRPSSSSIVASRLSILPPFSLWIPGF